jgi:hypothetical protein
LRLSSELGSDESVDIPVQDRGDVSDLDPGAMVFDHLIRVQHVGPDLRAEADIALFPGERAQLRLALLSCTGEET